MKPAVKTFTAGQLAALTEARLVGDPDKQISGVETLEFATPEDASFLSNLKYREAMLQSQAGLICMPPQIDAPEGKTVLFSDNPSRTFQQIVELLFDAPANPSGFTGIHPTAVVHPTAKIGKDVQIGPYVVIDQDAVIGDNTQLYPFVSIGARVQVGTHCVFHSHVSVRERCEIGNRVILQPGAVIGSCGFGYTTNAQGQHTKLEQLGIVIIEDDVEVGANTTIDRARFKATRISAGTKIDNLVQIGHNVVLGQHNIIVSQSGIAGSAKTGRNVVLGGQAGIVGHVDIADFVMIATRGGVSKTIKDTGKYAGGPVMTLSEHNRQQVHLRKIGEYVKRLEALEAKLGKET